VNARPRTAVTDEARPAFAGLFAEQGPAGPAHSVLAEEPLVAVVPEEHPVAGSGPVDLRQLAEAGAFVEVRPESGLRLQADAAFERAGVRRAVFELGTSDSVVRLVRLGFGAALVPASTASSATGVRVLRLSDPAARHPVSVVHRRPEPSTPSARAFLALLLGGRG
jgi:DNA-binding transcriptional LysR family regulator